MSKTLKIILIVLISLIIGAIVFAFLSNQRNNNNESIDNNVESEKKDNMENRKISLKINGEELKATLVDNSSTKALLDKLSEEDLTINMHDYSNFEKVGSLGFDLPRNDAQISTDAGDLILYQGNSFVIYYDKNNWNFTKLGKIDDVSKNELKRILGDGNVTVTISLY